MAGVAATYGKSTNPTAAASDGSNGGRIGAFYMDGVDIHQHQEHSDEDEDKEEEDEGKQYQPARAAASAEGRDGRRFYVDGINIKQAQHDQYQNDDEENDEDFYTNSDIPQVSYFRRTLIHMHALISLSPNFLLVCVLAYMYAI